MKSVIAFGDYEKNDSESEEELRIKAMIEWNSYPQALKDFIHKTQELREYRRFRHCFPTWEGKGFKVRGKNKQTQYAYGHDIEDSRRKGWDEIYINPADRQITIFVAKVDKTLWGQIPLKYQWYDKKSKKKTVNQVSERDSNIYNFIVETKNNYALFWAYDKYVIKNSKRGNEFQYDRHVKTLHNLEILLNDYNPEIIDCGYVPNPWYYWNVKTLKTDGHKKEKLSFNNILKTEELAIKKQKDIRNALQKKIDMTKAKLFGVKTNKPLSVRKLAKRAGVSVNTVQKYRSILEDKKLLKRIRKNI